MIIYKFRCPQCNTIYTRTDNPLNHFCEKCKNSTIPLKPVIHEKLKKKEQVEEKGDTTTERIRRAVERAFKRLVALHKLQESKPKISQKKEQTKVFQQWERLFNSRKVILKGFISFRLKKWGGVPDKLISNVRIDRTDRGTGGRAEAKRHGKENKEFIKGLDNQIMKSSKGYTLSDVIFEDLWCWALGRVDMIQERGNIFEDEYLRTKQKLFDGEKRRLLSIPYEQCKNEHGSVYSIFDKFVRQEIKYLKWQFEYSIITSGSQDKEIFEGEVEDKHPDWKVFTYDEQDEQNTEQFLDTEEPQKPEGTQATGLKPDLVYSPEETYISKETREEILIECRGVRRNLRTEALQEALSVWQSKLADLAMNKPIEAYMEKVGTDSMLWKFFSSMDIKAFVDLFRTMEGTEPFPTREEVMEAHTFSEIRKFDSVVENLDAELKAKLDKHRTDIEKKPLQKKLKRKGEKGFSYVNEPTQASKKTEGMQFQNKGVVEFSQRLNARKIHKLIEEKGGTSIKYPGWMKHFDKYEELRSWINFFEKLDLYEALELASKFQDGIRPTDDIDIEGFEELKSCTVVKTDGIFQAIHPNTIDDIKEKSGCLDVHLEPAKDHIKQNCLKIIFDRILDRLIEERKAEIREEKRIARKSKLEPYNEDKQAEYEMEIDNYDIQTELEPFDYNAIQAMRKKHRKDREQIEAKIKPGKRSDSRIQVLVAKKEAEQRPFCMEKNNHKDAIDEFTSKSKRNRGKEYFGEFCKCGEQMEYRTERAQTQAIDKYKSYSRYTQLPIWNLVYNGWKALQQLSIDHEKTEIPADYDAKTPAYDAYYKEWHPKWLEIMSDTMDSIAKPEPVWEDAELITVKLVCPKCGFTIDDIKFPEPEGFLKPDRYENGTFQGKRYGQKRKKCTGVSDIIKQSENNSP